MLETIRQKKENLFYSLMLFAIIGVMIFVYGSGKMSGSSQGESVVAWVNGEAITQRDFQQRLQYKIAQYQQMLGGQYDERLLSAFRVPESTLDELIQYRLLAQQAVKRGILVTDSELAAQIRTNPYFQRNGKFDSEQYLKLPNRGLEESRMRKDMETNRWLTYLLDRVRTTPEQLKRDLASSQAKVELAYAKIDFNSLAPKTEVTKNEIEDYSKKSQEDIRSYYDSHLSEFTEPAAVEIRKIRVGIPFEASETVKSAARKKAEEIKKEVTAANFETVAKSKSDDEFASKGGKAGWINRGTLEKPLEEALDKLSMGEVSPLIETQFGYFILKLENKKESKVKTLDSVTTIIAEKLIKEQRKNNWATEKRKSLEQLLADGKPADSELKKWKIDFKKTGAFNLAEGNIPGIGAVDSMLDGVGELSKASPQSKKLFYHQDHFYVVKLISFEPPKSTDLEKNKEASESKLVSSMRNALMTSWQEGLKKSASIDNELFSAKKRAKSAPETVEN